MERPPVAPLVLVPRRSAGCLADHARAPEVPARAFLSDPAVAFLEPVDLSTEPFRLLADGDQGAASIGDHTAAAAGHDGRIWAAWSHRLGDGGRFVQVAARQP